MDELIEQALGVVRGMWRRRWAGLLAAWVVALIGALVLLRTPDRYEANARVYVDSKSVLKPLMRDLAVEPDLEQTLSLLTHTLITRPNIELLIRKASLDAPSASQDDHELLVEGLTRDIKLAGSGRDNVFSFSYRSTSPAIAQRVVENLVALFVESDLGAKARDAESARGFIDQQIKAYEARLTEAENRLKEFKLRNLEITDTGGKDYFARIAALNEELSKQSVELRAAEQSRDALKRQLTGESESLLPDLSAQAVVPQTPELDARLDTQRRQLDELLRRYTDLHPDVIATKRLIAQLEEQKAKEIEAHKRAAANRPPSPAAVNPVMQQVQLAMAEAEGNVAALRVRQGETQARLTQLRAAANRVPQVEAELAQLNRDYDVVRSNYQALVARREKASMSEEVDSTRLAQFRVIDPPRTSDKPVFPSRLSMAPLVLLASLVIGAAVSFLVSQLMPTFDSAKALRNAFQRPILGSVSMLKTNDMLRRGWRQSIAFASGLGGLVAVYAGWLIWMSLRIHI